jgi:Uma2 family endonuclease
LVVSATSNYAEVTVVPRIAVRLPLELPQPEGFDFARPQTWPPVTGRLEFVDGRLEYMPPSGEVQQRTVVDVLTELNLWRREHAGFVVGGNEAGMLLGGEVRAADAAVWRDSPASEGFARTAPLLAVEVSGADDTVDLLRDKARWYLAHGVPTVWIVICAARSVTVVTREGEAEVAPEDRMPEPTGLPGLAPSVKSFFRQLS